MSSAPYDVVVVGSANLDLVASAPRLPGPGETVLGTHYAEHPGGKGLNQAIAAARAGAAVSLHGAVGDDSAGSRLRSAAEHDGVDTSALAIVAGVATGRAVITVDAAAENSIVVIAGANHHVRAIGPVASNVVLAQMEIPIDTVIEAFEAARSTGARTVLNPSPAQPLPDRLLALCNVVVPNEHELDLIGGIEHLLARGVEAVVTTRGAAGVTVTERADGETRTWYQAAFPTDPVDTTGAGDAFCGAMVARLAHNASLRTAVEFGAAAGALATRTAGAVPSLPHRDRIEALVSSSARGAG